MDNVNDRKYIRDKTAARFHGHDKLFAKHIPQIPESAEREYVKISAEYMKIVRKVMESELPQIKKIYGKSRGTMLPDSIRKDADEADTSAVLYAAIGVVFDRIRDRITNKNEGYGLRRKLENLANLTRKLTVKEWKKAIRSTLGIDIREDYYLGEFYQEALEIWVDENVNLIKTIPFEALDRMKSIIEDGYLNGSTTTKIVRQIQNAYGTSKRHANLIARDQVAKLNGRIQKAQQQDAGITEYKWCTCGDGRVRSSHKKLNGEIFKWSDPPVTDGGRKCHPGEDYQCRCIARPVFNRNTVNLPLKKEAVKISYK